LKLQRSMWPPAVVVGAVLGEDGPQVAFAEHQDAVGEFGFWLCGRIVRRSSSLSDISVGSSLC
jgi:hypothetical protein